MLPIHRAARPVIFDREVWEAGAERRLVVVFDAARFHQVGDDHLRLGPHKFAPRSAMDQVLLEEALGLDLNRLWITEDVCQAARRFGESRVSVTLELSQITLMQNDDPLLSPREGGVEQLAR